MSSNHLNLNRQYASFKHRCSQSRFVHFAEAFDKFGVPIQFNYDGKHVIKSIPGALMTLLLGLILATFAFQRFQELVYHSNPIISLANVQDYYTSSDKFNATENGFMVAFGVNHFRTAEALDDPAYV